MSAKNEKKVLEIRAWALAKGYTQDRYGNMKKEEKGRQYRLKFQATSLRHEVRTGSGDWVRIGSAYLKDISLKRGYWDENKVIDAAGVTHRSDRGLPQQVQGSGCCRFA